MPNLPCPPEVQIFTLDGVKYNGISEFIDHLLSKDIRVTPDQEAIDMERAKSYGYEHPAEAIASVNKRAGEEHKFLKDIPDKQLEQASKERKREQFDKKIDEAANKLIDFLTPKATQGLTKMGLGVDDIIKGATEIIKKAYHAGQDIAEAINKAIDYIRDNWDRKTMGDFDENKITDQLFDTGAFTIDEEIETRFGMTPEQVLDIWNNSDAGRNNPELLDFIQKLSGDEKKAIVKDALKGVVSDTLNKFVKVVREKTGNKIDILNKDDFKKAMDAKIQEELVKEAEKRQLTQEELRDAIKKSQQSKSFRDAISHFDMLGHASDLVKGVGLAFHPAMFEGKEFARTAMQIIRKEKSLEAAENEKADRASRKMMLAWTNVGKVEKLGFITSIENKSKYGDADPKYKALADSYRERMDAVFEMLSKIKDVNYLQDYFPHFWKNEKRAKSFFSKRPLEGSKSFLKQRFYSDILEGMNNGLELATDNPEEMVRLAEINAQRFKTAHDIFKEMKNRGLVRYYKNGKQPDNWNLVDDPIFKRMSLFTVGKGDETEAAMKVGGWYMPEAAARVVSNYLSKGLSGGGMAGRSLYNLVRDYNNLKNMYQLGVGFFHFTTTTNDALVTAQSNAMNKLLAGLVERDPSLILKAFKEYGEYLTILPSITKTLIAGHKILSTANKGNITSADVQDFINAGGRTGVSRLYRLESYYNLRKAIGNLRYDWNDMGYMQKTGTVAKAAGNLIGLPIEFAAKPLMNWWVPRLKAGGWYRSVQTELSIRKNLSPQEIQRVKERIMDDMDDRLGQMIYDNIFWNKSIKDLGFLIIRSLGWSGGTIRALGKGIGEAPGSAVRLFKGEGLSPRTAWMISLPIHVGLMGAMYQYMMSGQAPQDLQDYFFPWDGSYNDDGTKHRETLPSYMKDLIAYGSDIRSLFDDSEKSHALETIKNKTSPFLNEIGDIYSNKDFYGTQVWNPKDPIYQKGLELLEYEAKTFIPFSFKEPPGQKPTPSQSIAQKFGIMPAQKQFQRSPTQNRIMYQVQKDQGDEAKTEADAERISARHEVRARLFAGEDWDSLPDDLKNKAAYSAKTLAEVKKDATFDPYKRMFRDLKSEQQLNVWSKMTKEEKNDYGTYLNNKASFEALHEQKPEIFEEDPELQKAYDEIEGVAHETRGGKGIHKPRKERVI